MEPTDEQYFVINALETMGLIDLEEIADAIVRHLRVALDEVIYL